jgi:hypothetical protein
MKAYSAKQIRNKLIMVDTLKSNFEKVVKSTYGEEGNVAIVSMDKTENIDGIDYLVFIVLDENDSEIETENKIFKIAVQEYKSGTNTMMKVIKILN